MMKHSTMRLEETQEDVVAHSPGAVGGWGDAMHILVLFLARGQTALSQPLLSQGWLWGLQWEWE